MKLSIKTLVWGSLVMAMSMGACSSDDDDKAPPPSGDGDGDMGDGDVGDGDGDMGDGDGDMGDGDGDMGDGDGDMGGGGGVGGMGGGAATCDIEGFDGVGAEASEDSDALFVMEANGDSGAGAVVSTELWYTYGAPEGVFTHTEWSSYEDCATCVLIYDCEELDGLNLDDYEACTMFEVYEGTLDVTVNDDDGVGPFEATLTNAKAREVVIDSDTSVATPVENGRTWCIDSYSIDVVTE